MTESKHPEATPNPDHGEGEALVPEVVDLEPIMVEAREVPSISEAGDETHLASLNETQAPSSTPTQSLAQPTDQSPSQSPILLPELHEVFATALGDPTQRATWLHPSSLLFDFLAGLREHIFPLVIALFGAAAGGGFWTWLALVFFGLSIVASVLRYISTRYQFVEHDLVLLSGIIFRRQRTIPVARIQNVDIVQNVLHRLFGVAEVKIETGSGGEAEAKLRVLSLKDIDLLRNKIFTLQKSRAEVVVGSKSEDQSSEVALVETRIHQENAEVERRILRIGIVDLIWAGVISNRGMAIFAIVLGTLWQFGPQTGFGSEKQFYKQFERWIGDSVSWNSWQIVIAILVLLVAMRLISIGWFILRFYGYELRKSGNELRVSAGLWTKVSATIPQNRIQFISIHRNLMQRLIGTASIRIETAGGGVAQVENASNAISKRWFVPTIDVKKIDAVLSELSPDLRLNDPELVWKPLSSKAFQRQLRAVLLLGIAVAIPTLIFRLWWGVGTAIAILVLGTWWAWRSSRSMRFARGSRGVYFRSGLVNRKQSVAFFEKIQSVQLTSSPFDRRWRMASLAIDTAAAGPADHRIAIDFLDASFAQEEYEVLTRLIAKNQIATPREELAAVSSTS